MPVAAHHPQRLTTSLCAVLACGRYTLSILSDLAAKQNITDIGDDHIVSWANEKVRGERGNRERAVYIPAVNHGLHQC